MERAETIERGRRFSCYITLSVSSCVHLSLFVSYDDPQNFAMKFSALLALSLFVLGSQAS